MNLLVMSRKFVDLGEKRDFERDDMKNGSP